MPGEPGGSSRLPINVFLTSLAEEQRENAMVRCDIGLPEMDGYQVAKAIRETPAPQRAFLVALTDLPSAKDERYFWKRTSVAAAKARIPAVAHSWT